MDDDQQTDTVVSDTSSLCTPTSESSEVVKHENECDCQNAEKTQNGKILATQIAKLPERNAKFPIGAQVKHRQYAFRGIIFDVDPYFNNTEEWYESIPADIRPKKDQPFYHLLAENDEDHTYIAYVSEQNLLLDQSANPVQHADIATFFTGTVETGLLPRILAH